MAGGGLDHLRGRLGLSLAQAAALEEEVLRARAAARQGLSRPP